MASVAEIVDQLSEADRLLVAEKLVELDRKLERLLKRDAAIADSLFRFLKSKNPQAERLRDLIKEISKCHAPPFHD
jgi:hypothetical protein